MHRYQPCYAEHGRLSSLAVLLSLPLLAIKQSDVETGLAILELLTSAITTCHLSFVVHWINVSSRIMISISYL
jgi:hypothetical protein